MSDASTELRDKIATLIWDNCVITHDHSASLAEMVSNAVLEEAAKAIDARRDAYVNERGTYDPSTGVTELPGTGDEYVGELCEIAELLRALKIGSLQKRGPPAITWLLKGASTDIAERVIEMADRARVGHSILPGAQAKSFFVLDDVRFVLQVTVAECGSTLEGEAS